MGDYDLTNIETNPNYQINKVAKLFASILNSEWIFSVPTVRAQGMLCPEVDPIILPIFTSKEISQGLTPSDVIRISFLNP
ncbi:hypothetical protein BH23THE1_BH23THE1_18550 [soil metagenome]